MIIVDKALQKLGLKQASPIQSRHGGAGFMGHLGLPIKIINSVPRMELVAISNRNLDGPRAYAEAGIEIFHVVELS